ARRWIAEPTNMQVLSPTGMRRNGSFCAGIRYDLVTNPALATVALGHYPHAQTAFNNGINDVGEPFDAGLWYRPKSQDDVRSDMKFDGRYLPGLVSNGQDGVFINGAPSAQV